MFAEFQEALRAEAPPFSTSKPRYDLDTFVGRSLHFYSVNDPRTLLVGSEGLEKARDLLSRYKESQEGGAPVKASNDELWAARRALEATLHPDTGEPIPALLRFSAFAPVNMVLVTAMLTPAVIGSFPLTIGVHFINQTYNAAINFANRNASNPIPTQRLLEGYAGAVSTAVSIGMGATYLTKKAAAARPGLQGVIRATLPFLASSAAGAGNVALMRRTELMTGVDVFDHEGNNRGQSIIAGETGVSKCAAARVIWNIPIMMMPPVIMNKVGKHPLLAKSPLLTLATETLVVTAFLMGAVSPALAVFPQRDCLEVDGLEPQFRNLLDSSGQPVTKVWYNKGL
ncbi:unnamed protein product [Chrysoparadoxa australica]